MAKKKQETIEFRYYDMDSAFPILILSGQGWVRCYGSDAPHFHFHNILEIGLCHGGDGFMRFENGDCNFYSGVVTSIPKNVLHNTFSKVNTYSFWEYIFIDEEWLVAEMNRLDPEFAKVITSSINSRHLFLSAEDGKEMAALIQEIIRENENHGPYYKEVIKGLLYSLMILIARENRDFVKNQKKDDKSNMTKVRSVLEFIQTNYARELSILDLAQYCHMSETNFRRIFRKTMSMAPTDYLNMVRIQKACNLLLTTDYSVEIIAQQTGFPVSTTFNRNFKKFTGSSPYHWRKNNEQIDKSKVAYRIVAHQGWM